MVDTDRHGSVDRYAGCLDQSFDPSLGPIIDCIGIVGLRFARLEQTLGELSVLFEVRTGGKRQGILRIWKHTKLLSSGLESARVRLKEDSWIDQWYRWAEPFP